MESVLKSDACSRMSVEMRKSMYQMYKDGQLCDTKIVARGKKSFKAHRIILASCSGFFRALFTTSLGTKKEAQVSLPNVSNEVMLALFDYMYLRKMDLNDQIVGQVLITADYLMITGAIELCGSYLFQALNHENCLRINKFAKRYYLNSLVSDSWQYIMWHFPKIARENTELLNLPFEELCEIIKQDNLNAPSEEIVWKLVEKWLKANADGPKHLKALLETVRLGLLRPHYFLEHVRDHPIVAECDECRPILIDTIRYFFNLDLVPETTADYNLMHLARPRYAPDMLLAIGGWSGGSPTNCIEAYDVRADLWFQVHDVDPSGPRAYHGTIALDHNVYVIGGYNGMDYFNSCRCFNAKTRQWREIAPMNKPRCYVSVVTLEGCIYAMGGYNGTRRQSSAERYDPATNQWILIASMNHARSDASATAIKGQIVIVGGFNGQECLNTAEIYDPQLNSWTLCEIMGSRRSGVSCIAYNNLVHVLGGFNGINRLSTCEAYDLHRNTWTNMPEMPHARSNFAVGIIDNFLFAIGGFNGITTTAHVDYYDAKSEIWFSATPLNLYRSALSACVVKDLPNIQNYLSYDRDELLEAQRLQRLQNLEEQRGSVNVHATVHEAESQPAARTRGRGN